MLKEMANKWQVSLNINKCKIMSVHHRRYSIAFNAVRLLVGRQEGHPACKKTESWDAGMVVCLKWGADLHMAQLMPLSLAISCSSKSRLVYLASFTFLVLAHPGSSRQIPGAVNCKMVVVVVVLSSSSSSSSSSKSICHRRFFNVGGSYTKLCYK